MQPDSFRLADDASRIVAPAYASSCPVYNYARTRRVSRACSRNPECSHVGQILYSFSRSVMPSLATPEIVPVKPPVAAKKTGLPRASAATVSTVSVIVRTPDA